MKLFSLLLLLICCMAMPLKAEQVLEGTNCPKIRTIHIDARDVFEEEDEPSYLESALNYLHFTTRSEVVREELLFKENDCLDHELIEETARNLRSFSIFSDASVVVTPLPDTQDVDIYITTKDRFTLRAEFSASHNAGTTKTRISLGDKNLFGLNKALHISQTDEDGEKLTRYVYSDNRFFHDYVLNVTYAKERDGAQESYHLADPFRSLDDRVAYSFGYTKQTQDFVYTLDGDEELEIPQFYESESVGYEYEFGSRSQSKRLGIALSSAQQDYFSMNLPGEARIPDRLEKIDLDLIATITDRNEFIVMEGLDSLVYKEDIELLKSFFWGVGVQWRQDTSGIEYHPKYQFGIRQTRYNKRNVLSSYYLSHSGRYYQGELLEKKLTAFYHCYYMRKPGDLWLGGLTYQYRYGRDVLNDPLTMGGDVGLRGYKAASFTGNKSLLFNLEYRRRLPTIWSKVAMGQAFFADSGFAWKKGDNVELSDLKSNVGWGLRFDIPSIFGENILRFDLAVATDTGEVLPSIVLGQVFRYDSLSENNQKDF